MKPAEFPHVTLTQPLLHALRRVVQDRKDTLASVLQRAPLKRDSVVREIEELTTILAEIDAAEFR